MPAENEFVKNVSTYKTDPATGQPLKNPDGAKVVDKAIGVFAFRKPTVQDEMRIAVQRQVNLQGLLPIQVDQRTFILCESFARLPLLCTKSPDGWDWTKLTDEQTLLEIYYAYMEEMNPEIKTEDATSAGKEASEDSVR